MRGGQVKLPIGVVPLLNQGLVLFVPFTDAGVVLLKDHGGEVLLKKGVESLLKVDGVVKFQPVPLLLEGVDELRKGIPGVETLKTKPPGVVELRADGV